jgi:colanic acid biosynthesis glycosyl transferase WcaI
MKAMVEDTLSAGIDVHVISSHTTGQNEDIPEEFCKYSGFTFSIVERAVVDKHAFVKRYLSGIKFAWDCRKFIRNVQDYDLIYVQSCPTALYNLLIARLFGNRNPIIYSIQDMFPGSSIASGVMKSKWMQIVFYQLQKIAYRYSDAITVISEDMSDKVLEQGVREGKIYEIVNWYDDRTVQEVHWEDNRFVRKYDLPKDKFYVQYAGTMGYVFDYQMVLKVAELLKDYTDIEFQMIGKGSQKETFMKEKERRGLINIVFYPLEPEHMVSDVYSTCSACLIPLKRGIIGNSVPSKAALLMACKRPIINSVDKDSHYYRMFNENQIGISVSNEDPEALAEAILRLYHDKSLREEMAVNGYHFGKEHYARSKNTKKLIDLFYTIANKDE